MDAMEIDDDVHMNGNLTMERLINQVDLKRRKQPSRCGTVCLGLLCAVLLAGNIGQIIYYEIIGHHASPEPTQASYNSQRDRLQSSYDALTADRKQQEARLTNLTTEKEQLQQSYKSLAAERDEFKVNFNNLKNERDQLQVSCNTFKQESHQLQTSYNDMQRDFEGLQTNYNHLTSSKEQLQTNYSNLQRGNDELQTTLHQLQGSYSSLNRDRNQLQSSYNTLNISRNQLQISYNSLWKDKERLQSSYNALQSEKEQLQSNYSSLATGRDQLQKKIDKVRRSLFCQSGWSKFDVSCYFVSTAKRNWTLSRRDCVSKGADLVVIDTRDEQTFVNKLLKSGQNAWIGLTDSLQEGTWMWVDGSPVTTTFWQPNQPNSFNGNQDCGELVREPSGVGEWNDDGCFAEQIWICEK
ncbi:asialoglycoprotein receptor 1-like [Chelmon rostratus]|uniref:asialoglycoprotein receptor 1-like n=1 Tax=Chelmon rostratus TaxID=109905 RepID=UPI001BEAFC5B|nr:asialoglycoprotein receptor 1-like [Chelmon rostratus]